MARVVELQSPLSVEVCAEHIRAAIDSDAKTPAPGSQAVIGRVSGNRVRLRKRPPGENENSFKPVLIGRLVPNKAGTVLRCRVGMHPGSVGCMVVWVAAVSLITVGLAIPTTDDTVEGSRPWAIGWALFVSIFGIKLVVMGVGMMFYGRHSARGEAEFLLTFVAGIITAKSHHEADEIPPDSISR